MLHVFLYYDLSPVLFLFYCFPLILFLNLPFLTPQSVPYSLLHSEGLYPHAMAKSRPTKKIKKNVSYLADLLGYLFIWREVVVQTSTLC